MSKNNDVFCADLAAYYRNCKPTEPCPPGFYWAPAPPPPIPADYPKPPIPKHTCGCCEPIENKEVEEVEVKRNSTEGQICKLSKKAAALNRLLTNIIEKKKDIIIKVGVTSFNFGNIETEYMGWDEDGEKSYAASIKKVIEHQRALVMTEIKELADALDDEATENTNVEGAITGD